MTAAECELLQSSTKKMYELVLSAKEPGQQLSSTLDYLIKHCLECHEHFSFLLHRVNWFQSPFTIYRDKLFKVCRLYRSTGRQSARVVYNMIIEGFFHAKFQRQSLLSLMHLFGEARDQKTIITALRDNYPHKLCPLELHTFYLNNLLELSRQFKCYRVDFLQIIFENMVKFDTQIVAGDQWVHKPFPIDHKLLQMRKSSGNSELVVKLDHLMVDILHYLDELDDDKAILDELLLVFQNKVLPIKTTKNIQLCVFLVAQKSKTRANAFISFLLASIFQSKQQQNWYRIYSQSTFYLFSYLLRSKKVTNSTIIKTLSILVQQLTKQLQEIDDEKIDQNMNLKELLQARQISLFILQVIIMIKVGRGLEREDVNQIYEKLLRDNRRKLYFDLFLREEILQKIGVQGRKVHSLRLKFSNKFLPSTLPLTGNVIDHLMVMQEGVGDGQSSGQSIRKMHKGQTPISYCSQTVI